MNVKFFIVKQTLTTEWPKFLGLTMLMGLGWVAGLSGNKTNLSPAKLKLSGSWTGPELGIITIIS